MLRSLLICVLLAAPAAADDFEGEVPVKRQAKLRIALERGDVSVVTHELETVRLEARARGSGASAIHFEVREDRAGWVFESRAEAWLRWLSTGPRVNVRAWVPRAVALEIEFPTQPPADAFDAWSAANPSDFGETCALALSLADPATVDATEYDQAVEEAVAEMTSVIVEELLADRSPLEEVLEELPADELAFCAASPELVLDAAFVLGRLPAGASAEFESYWAITRPLEFAAACREAFAGR